MFPLFRNEMPSSASELEQALNGSLTRLFSGVTDPVSVRDQTYPQLSSIDIALDGAQLRTNAPRPPKLNANAKPALDVAEMNISANDICVGPATANLRLRAADVQLQQTRDASGEIVLLLQRASTGEIEVSADKAEIENGVAAVARSEAGKHGVTIDNVKLTIASRGERGVDAEVQLRARKLFFSTTVRISAKLDLDEQLNARLSGLTCNGEGAIGALACGTLQPHIEKMNGRSFSLMALPLGEVRLRDVRIAAGDRIAVSAEFGA
jgi:hypothetical protein